MFIFYFSSISSKCSKPLIFIDLDTTDEHTTSSSDGDNFVTKINADGTYGWTKTTSGSDEVHTCSVAVDSSGNLYVTGALYGTADFDPGTGTDEHTSSGSYDIFLMKFSQ